MYIHIHLRSLFFSRYSGVANYCGFFRFHMLTVILFWFTVVFSDLFPVYFTISVWWWPKLPGYPLLYAYINVLCHAVCSINQVPSCILSLLP